MIGILKRAVASRARYRGMRLSIRALIDVEREKVRWKGINREIQRREQVYAMHAFALPFSVPSDEVRDRLDTAKARALESVHADVARGWL
jgi:hypothetical protein